MNLRHVGGGPAMRGRDGRLLTDLEPDGVWDWRESGVVEMNCFLCHIPDPNNEARVAAIEEGRFRWASTAAISTTAASRSG